MSTLLPRLPWLNASCAANGHPVNANFAKWFGASQIVGNEGLPTPVFHGTTTRFMRFQLSRTGAQGPGIYLADCAEAAGGYGTGMVMPLYLRMESPFIFRPSDESLEAEVNGELLDLVLGPVRARRVVDRMDREGPAAYGFEVMHELRAAGHDGILMVYPWASTRPAGTLPRLRGIEGDAVLIAFSPEQLKSAESNSGLYSRDSACLHDSEDRAKAAARARIRSR